jgi:hypothetical protein
MSNWKSLIERSSRFLWILLALGCGYAVIGCSSPVIASTNPSDYVGEYVLHPGKGDHVKFADFLILKADHSAVGIRFSDETQQVLQSKLRWNLDHTTTEDVVIGDFSYPVAGEGSSMKLSVNDDLGQYYEKVR